MNRIVGGVLVLALLAWALGQDLPGSWAGPVSVQDTLPESIKNADDKQSVGQFAVLELFTSEGCNSCPPADRISADIANAARAKKLPILVLGYHVDYWNYLGWDDRFSEASYSQRQKQYTKALKERTFTPQLIINGTESMVGSRASSVKKQLKAALAQKHTDRLELTRKDNDDSIDVTYKATLAHDKTVLQIALLQKSAQTDVKQGENKGVTLKHSNIVRMLKTVDLSKSKTGTVTLPVPKGLKLDNIDMVGFLQTGPVGPITAAARANSK